VRPRAFTPIADPLRLLSWESRNRAAVGSDILCRLSTPRWAFLNPPLLASTHRKTHRCEYRQTRAANPPCPLGHGERTTQDALDWLDLTSRQGGPTGKLNRSLPSARAPSSRVPRTGPVRVPIRCRPAISPGSTPRMTPAQRERCLLPTICNRLVVTCTPHDTPLPSSGALAPPTTALPPRFLQAG